MNIKDGCHATAGFSSADQTGNKKRKRQKPEAKRETPLPPESSGQTTKGKKTRKITVLEKSTGPVATQSTIVNTSELLSEQQIKRNEQLIETARAGNIDDIKALLEQGADINLRCGYDHPIATAAREGHLDMVRYLHKKGAITDQCFPSPIIEAAQNGHVDVVRYLHRAGVSADSSQNGTSLIGHAIIGGHIDVVKYLIKHGVDVNSSDQYTDTPMCEAAEWGRFDIVSLLVDKGADIDGCRKGAHTPIYIAACNGHRDIVKFLVAQGANVNAFRSGSKTPIYAAAMTGDRELVKYFLEQGVDVNANSTGSETPVWGAANAGHYDMVQYLRSAGATFEKNSTKSETLIAAAARGGLMTLVQELLQEGGYISTRDDYIPLINDARFFHHYKLEDYLRGQFDLMPDPLGPRPGKKRKSSKY
ncbi:ankyrin repeat domain-containing protein [Thalassotalea sp. G20_0]|uniref:ankyrin repeat domain-containing protein n=1 Tax=Thalassotalea sp. G20_0 TaxID=2821093 RepID=UPI001ADB3FF1|nr:ankyrin repeat domain-containing protein [Thalassotalea sp. G20_0]MBO9495741.1 ankyrin repeat domain-containing protein [Thalassotalea sp. G20_0]